MKRNTHGFTLIEVMIAMLVMSLGMLGIASTLITAVRSASSNYLKQQAVQYTYDIADRMRSNFILAKDPTAANPYITALSAPAAAAAKDCTAAVCSTAEMAAYDVWQWKSTLKNNLPGGLGSITVAAGPLSGTDLVTVVVQWSDQPAQSTFKQAVAPNTYTVVTEL